ncbi:MAG: hydrolase [Rheinheimera sp.]|nr:MAG: hydrolase [Rheinheimera sp.]
MLLTADQSLLLLIDLQKKLAPAIHNNAEVEQHCRWLVEVARELAVPILATEQYPQGLGVTLPSLLSLLKSEEILEKIHFSAYREPHLQAALADSGRRQIVLCGTEAHVCVLQTALDLISAGYQVFVVAEACGSRRDSDKQLALRRLQQAGAVIVSREMVAFEWLQQAGTAQFRHVSKGWLR